MGFPTNINLELWTENFKHTVTAGQSALKSAILINGGGSVAIIALIGNILNIPGQPNQIGLHSLSYSLKMFAIGTLCAAIATGATYLAQFYYANELFDKNPKAGYKLPDLINVVGVGLVFCSYSQFWLGMHYTFIAFSR